MADRLLSEFIDTDATEADTCDLSPILARSCSPEEVRLHQFGDYELVGEIARGGMGVVFRALQVSLARPVALKFLRGQALDSEVARRRFRLEADAAARLEHPHIVPVYETGDYKGVPFLCTKFIEGGTLADRLATMRDQGGGREALRKQTPVLLAKVARAVHHAHGRGILHRDLKPSNLLLDRTGEPFVTDFGLAKLLNVDGDLTQSQAILGTPRYMSPEQCRGDNDSVSTASDVYALGVILYEMLAGEAPFDGGSTLAIMRKVTEERPPALRLTGRARDLEKICLKCLEKNPSDRYVSALALAEELERYQRYEPILARPTGTLEQIVMWGRRKPALMALSFVSILSLVVGFGAAVWQAQQAIAAHQEVAVQFYAANIARVSDAVDEGHFDRARSMLLQHVPDAGQPDLRGWEWRWLWSQTEPAYETLFEAESAIWGLAFAPGNQQLAFGTNEGTVYWHDIAARTTRAFHKTHLQIRHVILSPDGNWLAVSARKTLLEENGTEKQTAIYKLTNEGPESAPSRSYARSPQEKFARGCTNWQRL